MKDLQRRQDFGSSSQVAEQAVANEVEEQEAATDTASASEEAGEFQPPDQLAPDGLANLAARAMKRVQRRQDFGGSSQVAEQAVANEVAEQEAATDAAAALDQPDESQAPELQPVEQAEGPGRIVARAVAAKTVMVTRAVNDQSLATSAAQANGTRAGKGKKKGKKKGGKKAAKKGNSTETAKV